MNAGYHDTCEFVLEPTPYAQLNSTIYPTHSTQHSTHSVIPDNLRAHPTIRFFLIYRHNSRRVRSCIRLFNWMHYVHAPARARAHKQHPLAPNTQHPLVPTTQQYPLCLFVFWRGWLVVSAGEDTIISHLFLCTRKLFITDLALPHLIQAQHLMRWYMLCTSWYDEH